MIAEGGKIISEADAEVSEAIDFAEYYARILEQYVDAHGLKTPQKRIALITSPWNFPCSIPLNGILASLGSNQAVIFKPAVEALLTGYTLSQILWEAGIPQKALQFISCKDETTGSFLIQHPKISTVILTGATQTARNFLHMRPNLNLFAETGGKNSIIVSAISDKDLAIKDIIQSSFGYSGQKCSACSLLILEEELYNDEKFLKNLCDAAKSLPVGSAWDLHSKVTPLIRPPGPHLLRALTSLDPYEKWLLEPKQDPHNPHLWSPGIKLGVTHGNFTHQTELFGPVLGVMCAKNIDQAIHLANATPYGLTAGLHTLNKQEKELWQRKIHAGNCYINRTITGAICARQPFGGIKASSFGKGMKAGGENYVLQFFTETERDPAPSNMLLMHPALTRLQIILENLGMEKEEKDRYLKGAGSYLYWFEAYFTTPQELSHLIGQDNIRTIHPHKELFIVLQKGDDLIDVFLLFAAASVAGTKLIIFTQDEELLHLFRTDKFTMFFKQQDWNFLDKESTFLQEFDKASFSRVRALQNLPEHLAQTFARSAFSIDSSKPILNGRFELLRFAYAVSLSADYHRYGNLLERETELRKPTL